MPLDDRGFPKPPDDADTGSPWWSVGLIVLGAALIALATWAFQLV